MNNIKNNYAFLVAGTTVKPTTEFKRYVGCAQTEVIALNPTKKELEAIYGREVKEDPVYCGRDEQTGVKWGVLDFIVKTVKSECGVEMTNHARFFLREEKWVSKDGSKVCVIDRFGNYKFISTEDAEKKTKFESSKIGDYRPAYRGEPEVIDFLRKFINVPDPFAYDSEKRKWYLRDNIKWEKDLTKDEAEKGDVLTFEKCMMCFDKNDFDNFFKGNTSELWALLKSRIELEPLGVTLLYGVRTSQDNKQYQEVLTSLDMVLKKNPTAKNFEYLEKILTSSKERGMYASTEVKVQPLSEYKITPTDFSTASEDTTPTDDVPFPDW